MTLDEVVQAIRTLRAAGVAEDAILAAVKEALDGPAAAPGMVIGKHTPAELRALARVGSAREYRDTMTAIRMKREMSGGAR